MFWAIKLSESMSPTVVLPIRGRRVGGRLAVALWCHIGGCVGSSSQVGKGSHGLFKLGRCLGGIGVVISSAFRGEEALSLIIGHLKMFLEIDPSLLNGGDFTPVVGFISEDTRFLQDNQSLADSGGFRDFVTTGMGETSIFSDASPEPFQEIVRVPPPVQHGCILVKLIRSDRAICDAQVGWELKDGYPAIAPQLVTQFVDICIVDCRKELQFEAM